MWRIIYKNKVIDNFKEIVDAKQALHNHRLNGGDGFIYMVDHNV